MRMNGQHFTNTDLLNKFLYNGKELQEQTNYYDYGFRQLDPALGRWHVIDVMAESHFSESPYSYAGNNPDVLGLDYHYNWDDGNYYDDNGNAASWSEVHDWIEEGINNGSIDGVILYNGNEGESGHWENHNRTSRSFGHGGWGRKSAGKLSFGQKLRRFFNNFHITKHTYSEKVWVGDDGEDYETPDEHPTKPSSDQKDYKANLVNSTDPIYDIFYAIHMAVKDYGAVTNLYDII